MLKIIRKGDKATHGGSVLTASATMKFGGIGAARKNGGQMGLKERESAYKICEDIFL